MEIKSLIKNKNALFFTPYHPFAHPLSIAQTEELKELGRSANLRSIGMSYQVIKKPHPAFFIGKGKIEELKETLAPYLQNPLKEKALPIVVFNCSLSGVQIRNLEKDLKVMVIDRNQLILDIFAQRARTYEGKLQVELARALDELPRLSGAWLSSLSRQGGGIGTRGPGEKAIEKDRRQIKLRAKQIRKKLEKIQKVRKGHRALRKKNHIPTIALIGYTNSGKSTLLNTLSRNSTIPTKNLPFMTLDPTVRKVHLGFSKNILITDTVGFIQDLSPHLIEAFKATLEESASADILLNVIDLSSPLMKEQMQTVQKLITEFGWDQKPCIHVYNKMDIAPKDKMFQTDSSYPKVAISAIKGTGLDTLKQKLVEITAQMQTKRVQLYFPKKEEEKVYALDREAFICKKETSSLGVLCDAHIGPAKLKEWEPWIIKKTS